MGGTKRDNANGLEDAGVHREELRRKFTSHLGGDASALRNDSDENDEHAYEGQGGGFGKLWCNAEFSTGWRLSALDGTNFGNVAVERKRVGYAEDEDNNDRSAVGE